MSGGGTGLMSGGGLSIGSGGPGKAAGCSSMLLFECNNFADGVLGGIRLCGRPRLHGISTAQTLIQVARLASMCQSLMCSAPNGTL